jgi:hypothetical protein
LFNLCFFSLLPKLIGDDLNDELVEATYYGISYLFAFFSNYSWTVLDIEKLIGFVASIKIVLAMMFKSQQNVVYLSHFSKILEYANFLDDVLNLSKYIDASSSAGTLVPEEILQISPEDE